MYHPFPGSSLMQVPEPWLFIGSIIAACWQHGAWLRSAWKGIPKALQIETKQEVEIYILKEKVNTVLQWKIKKIMQFFWNRDYRHMSYNLTADDKWYLNIYILLLKELNCERNTNWSNIKISLFWLSYWEERWYCTTLARVWRN